LTDAELDALVARETKLLEVLRRAGLALEYLCEGLDIDADETFITAKTTAGDVLLKISVAEVIAQILTALAEHGER
jgi:hypothetical protein